MDWSMFDLTGREWVILVIGILGSYFFVRTMGLIEQQVGKVWYVSKTKFDAHRRKRELRDFYLIQDIKEANLDINSWMLMRLSGVQYALVVALAMMLTGTLVFILYSVMYSVDVTVASLEIIVGGKRSESSLSEWMLYVPLPFFVIALAFSEFGWWQRRSVIRIVLRYADFVEFERKVRENFTEEQLLKRS